MTICVYGAASSSIDKIYTEQTELLGETMRERKKTMEELSDAFIVAPGGIGTFDEFFEIFTLQNLGRHTKPIAIFNVNSYYDPMLQMLQCQVNDGFISKKALERLIISDDPCEILDKIASYIHIS